MQKKKFITIKENVDDEFVEKKSTFITHLIRISSEEEAKNFIQSMKKKHYTATHVCSAFVVGDNNEITRANDDGEPQGTAGAPMLDVLLRQDIKNVCAVVIRYFGGIKLGTGGLVRAYGGGVINALKKANFIERLDAYEIFLEIDYSYNPKIEYEIEKTSFLTKNKTYSDKITYTLHILEEDYNNFLEWITSLTSNNFKILKKEFKQLEFDVTK